MLVFSVKEFLVFSVFCSLFGGSSFEVGVQVWRGGFVWVSLSKPAMGIYNTYTPSCVGHFEVSHKLSEPLNLFRNFFKRSLQKINSTGY